MSAHYTSYYYVPQIIAETVILMLSKTTKATVTVNIVSLMGYRII